MSDNTAMVLIFATLGLSGLFGLMVLARAYVETQRIRFSAEAREAAMPTRRGRS